ncbi:MAG: hypothetical protein ACLQUY_24230 [Ktedonobacterales bacterium]
MRVTLDEMIVSLRESLTQMVEALDRLLVAAYDTSQAHRSEVVAEQQWKIDRDMVAMEALVIDVLATQQPVLATDLSVVKGLLVASRELGNLAHEQRDLAHLMDQLGIQDPQLPPEVAAVLPDLRKVVADSVTAFLQDDRVLAESTFERLRQLGLILQAVPMSPHPPTLVPVTQLHLFALGRILAAAADIARSAPIYRYVSAPA